MGTILRLIKAIYMKEEFMKKKNHQFIFTKLRKLGAWNLVYFKNTMG